MTKTQDGINQGNKVPILPFPFTLYGEWDLGARYPLEPKNAKPITIRANIENVLDNNAWYGSLFAGQIFVRDSRTFLLSATFDF